MLKSKHKDFLKDMGRRVGLDIRLNTARARDDLRLVKFLKDREIDLVLDVGANRGQFGKLLFNAGFAGDVISFEALPEAHKILTQEASAFAGKWKIAQRAALTDRDGEVEFHISQADACSSMLRPNQDFLQDTSFAKTTATITVDAKRLDGLLPLNQIKNRRCFLKIDVQGAELKVIKGASGLRSALSGLLVEMSNTPLYDGQTLFDDVHALIRSQGFELWDVWPGHRDNRTLRLLQMDCLYFDRR
jgi:FkbM family methyltransferase